MDGFWVAMVRYLASLCVPATLDAADKNGRTGRRSPTLETHTESRTCR
jgi:hypothetical protein